MKKAVSVHNPITNTLSARMFVSGRIDETRFRTRYEATELPGGYLYDADENITWIRGHHAPGSRKVGALLAAYALSQDTRWPGT